jgi:aminoglycoside 3-N-acetyltransferase
MDLLEHMSVDKDQLIADIRKIGVNRGDHIAVALSLKSIGFVKGGPDAFIDSLLEVIGSEGTLMMNTFTLSFPIAEIDPNYIFELESTIPYTGIVPTKLMKRKGSIRSRHPTSSIVASGRLARYLTDGHDEHSDAYLPYAKLAQIGGKYLSIGIGNRLVAIRHEAQREAGLFIVPFIMGVRYRNPKGQVSLFTWVDPPCFKKLPELVPKIEQTGMIKRGKIGLADSIVAPADKLIEAMATILKKDPTLNLCDDFSCLKCRELERRMKLYGKIRDPKFFQRSSVIRQLLGFRNNLILRRHSYISFRNPKKKKTFRSTTILEIGTYRLVWLFSKILDK